MLVASVQDTKRIVGIAKGTYKPLMLKSNYLKYGGNFYRGYRYMINELSKKTGKVCINGYTSPYWVWVMNPFFKFFDSNSVKDKCVIIFDVDMKDLVMSDFDKWNACLDGDLELSECIIKDSDFSNYPVTSFSRTGLYMGGARFPISEARAPISEDNQVRAAFLPKSDLGMSTASLYSDGFLSTKSSKGILSKVNYRVRINSHFGNANGLPLGNSECTDYTDKCIQGVCLDIPKDKILGIYPLKALYDKDFVTIGGLYQYCKLLQGKYKLWERGYKDYNLSEELDFCVNQA